MDINLPCGYIVAHNPSGVKVESVLNMEAWQDAYAMRQREGEISTKPYRYPALRRANEQTLHKPQVTRSWQPATFYEIRFNLFKGNALLVAARFRNQPVPNIL
jgi:hypothetical protein